MTYEFHYPTPSDWHEEGKEPKQSLEDYMKDAEVESKIHDKRYNDYAFLEHDRKRYSFDKALDVLCDVDIITAKEKDNYLQSRKSLHDALKAEVAPYKFSEDTGERTFLGGIGGAAVGVLASLGVLATLKACGYDDAYLNSYGPLMIAGILGSAIPGAVLTYLGLSRSAKKKIAEAKKIDIERAYDDFIDSLEPFRDFSIEGRNYNEEKIKKYERKDVFDAVADVRRYMDYLTAEKRFTPE